MRRALSVSISTILFMACAAPVRAQWIAAAYGGTVHTQPADIHIDDGPTTIVFPRVTFASRSFSSPIYYGYRFGRVISPRRGVFVEGELIHAKVYAEADGVTGSGVLNGTVAHDVPFASVVQRFAISHGLNFLLANAGIRHRIWNRATLTARAGAGPLIPHPEIAAGGIAHEGYQLSGVGIQGAAGVELRLWSGVSVIAEYKWTRAHPRVSFGEVHAELPTVSQHVAIGVSTAFGR
jgi:opacity protein-like surface antigen